jgi:hypothetical protein
MHLTDQMSAIELIKRARTPVRKKLGTTVMTE